MFKKKDKAVFFRNPFDPLQLDITNPNLQFNGLKSSKVYIHYYQEKKIIEFLQQQVISEQDYQTLFLLVSMPIPAEHCIAEASWLPIANLLNFEAFKAKEQEIKSSLSERLNCIQGDARFVYKTPNQTVCLLQRDVEKLDNRLIELLTEKMKGGEGFTVADLLNMECQLKQEMYAYAKQCTQLDDDRLLFEFTLRNSSEGVVHEESYKLYQSCRKSLSESWPQLLNLIVKMRFFLEFDESANGYSLQRELEDNLFKEAVRRDGFQLSQGVANSTKYRRIQEVLDQLLFEESRESEIQRLVRLGADPNAKSDGERTLLDLALRFGQVEKALQLLSLGADPELSSLHTQDQSNLMAALNQEKSEKLVVELIKRWKDFNHKNQKGETALIVAIQKKASFFIVSKLIENTKDINALTHQGYRALDFAIRERPGDFQIIKKLIEAGASAVLRNDDGNFPLIEAASCCNLQAVKIMFQEAPELIHECNNKGETALLAVLNGPSSSEACDIIDFLMKNGANPEAVNQEGQTGFALAKKSPLLQAQLERTAQDIAKKSLNPEMFTAFIVSLAQLMNNKNHRMSSACAPLMKRYLSYLHGLEGNNTPRSNASLLAQIIFLQKQPDFNVSFLPKILDDIRSGGDAHKTLLKENPDLIDRFSRIEYEAAKPPPKLPFNMRTSRSFMDNKQLNLGESAYLFSKLEEFLKKERLELGEDFAFILSDPRFWALPKETLKLIHDNQGQCKQLIKEWGLSYEQLRELTQKKLLIFSKFEALIDGLKQKMPLHELIHFNEDRLVLLLDNPQGLYALLNLNVSFERLRRMDSSQLNLWLENPSFLNFLCLHKINVATLFTLDVLKFNVLASQLEQITRCLELNLTFDALVKLSIKELTELFARKLAEGLEPSPGF